MKDSKREYRNGLLSMIACGFLWGVLPVYWQALRPIDSWVIIFYRIFLVGLVSGIASLKIYGFKAIKEQFKIKGNAWKFPLAGILITCNWSIYIWAVNADHVIQTCVGYYIEPLVVALFGIIFFKEKLTFSKLIAMIFALGGLTVVLVHFMEVPTIALGLATTFAAYSAIKKYFSLPAIMSVFLETLFLMPPALAVVIWLECTGHGALGVASPGKYLLLLCCGILTATPLSFFAAAAEKLPLITVGLMEYISPSISLVVGIFLLNEPFDFVQFAAFVIVWIGLMFFTYGEVKSYKGVEMMFDAETIKNDIVKWIRDWFDANGKGCNAVIGISGGKDSSVVAALCTEALGKDRVVGVMMPRGEQFDIDVSHALIKHLGIKGIVMNVSDACEGIESQVKKEFGDISAQTKTNIPPRIRMTMLYAVCQTVNGRVANTCNLSEDYVGYNTIFGDNAGDFSPLSKLTVQEVKAVGRACGLPSMFTDKVPIDGLQGKTDEDNLGFTYADLDRYIREGICENKETLEKIQIRHRRNLFKLQPMPTFEYEGEIHE